MYCLRRRNLHNEEFSDLLYGMGLAGFGCRKCVQNVIRKPELEEKCGKLSVDGSIQYSV